MPELRLWSWVLSPFASKVRIVMAEKGVEADVLEIDPANRPARLRELNPTGRVPVLEVDGTAVFESSVICEWLDELRPTPPMWPADATARAAARGLARWVDDELTRPFFVSMRKTAFGIDVTDHPDVVTHLRERVVRHWPVAEELLSRSEGPWMLPGTEPTLLDLSALALSVRLPRWAPELAPDPEAQPRVTAWLERLRERPSAAAVRQKGRPVSDPR
jgi:glutathione S-transferase